MMLKILQITTVSLFAATIITGVCLLFFAPDKLEGFSQLIGSVWPLFLMEIVPAFLGQPLKDFVKAKNDKAGA